MGSSHGFRPPQFSEDDAWMPTWLQQCYFDRFPVEGVEKDHVNFEQRNKELQILGTSINNAESSRDCGGCKISQLFLSGTDSSPLNFAQSVDNVVTYHLHLSSDGNSENSTPVTGFVETESNCHFVMLPLDDSKILGREAISPRELHNSRTIESSPKVELCGHTNQDGLLKCGENVIFSDCFVDTVELCIAASETLVINEVIKNDSSVKPSTSATLEASVQMKQARLEACEDAICESLDKISDIDNLSDLDDIAMESAYEDMGIHFDELHSIELNISQVKDTLDSEYDEKTGAFSTDCGSNDGSSTHGIRGGVVIDAQLTNSLVVEFFDGNTMKKVTENLAFGLGVDEMGQFSDCLKHVQTSEEIFAKPSVGETSFFSESADVAPDENSEAQNHDKGTIITSQLSVPSESFGNRAMEGISLSQDVKSSRASFLDPLCSVVPCSISENICSSPATNQDDEVLLRNCSIPTDDISNFSGPSDSNNNLSQVEGTAMQISNIKEPQDTVYRRLTSLRNYSTLGSGSATFLENDSHQKGSLWIDNKNELLKEKNSTFPLVVNRTRYHQATSKSINNGEENQSCAHAALQKDTVKLPISEVLECELLKCTNLSDKCHPASRHTHFSEKETAIHHKNCQKSP